MILLSFSLLPAGGASVIDLYCLGSLGQEALMIITQKMVQCCLLESSKNHITLINEELKKSFGGEVKCSNL